MATRLMRSRLTLVQEPPLSALAALTPFNVRYVCILRLTLLRATLGFSSEDLLASQRK